MLLQQVQIGVSDFLFKLLILGGFTDVYGRLWLRHSSHIYAVEFTNPRNRENGDGEYRQVVSVYLFIFFTFSLIKICYNLLDSANLSTYGFT